VAMACRTLLAGPTISSLESRSARLQRFGNHPKLGRKSFLAGLGMLRDE